MRWCEASQHRFCSWPGALPDSQLLALYNAAVGHTPCRGHVCVCWEMAVVDLPARSWQAPRPQPPGCAFQGWQTGGPHGAGAAACRNPLRAAQVHGPAAAGVVGDGLRHQQPGRRRVRARPAGGAPGELLQIPGARCCTAASLARGAAQTRCLMGAAAGPSCSSGHGILLSTVHMRSALSASL